MLHVLLITLVVLVAGCSIKKDMEETKKTTQEMKDISSAIKTSQEYLTILARAGSTGAFTIEQFERVKSADNLSDKLELTTAYFAGMEYQYWLGWGQDTEELRESMWAKGIEMFFSHIDGLVDDNYPLDGSWWSLGYKLSDNQEALGIVSVAMSKVSSEQERMTKKFGIKSYSAYDLIKEGLQYKADYEAGNAVPDWAVKVLRNEKTAIYLLQLRHNFYPLIVLSRMTKVEDGPKWFLAKSLVEEFQIDLSNFSKAELDYYQELLAKGVDARLFLERTLCLKPQYAKLTQHFYSTAVFQTHEFGNTNAQSFLLKLQQATKINLKAQIVGLVPQETGSEKTMFIDHKYIPQIKQPDGTMTLPSGF